MIIAIDIGNTRIKWGVHNGVDWLDSGVLATGSWPSFADVARTLPLTAQVILSSVASETVMHGLIQALQGRPVHVFQASGMACGVRNAYTVPNQLGSDRWAALLGAWCLGHGACLVVCAGTATTVDILDDTACFQGGVIVPGYDMMRRSLHEHTAALPLTLGSFDVLPRNTADAIATGCIEAQLGAIAGMRSRAPPATPVFLTGGGASHLLPLLPAPVRHVDRLVLEGLLCFGREIGVGV